MSDSSKSNGGSQGFLRRFSPRDWFILVLILLGLMLVFGSAVNAGGPLGNLVNIGEHDDDDDDYGDDDDDDDYGDDDDDDDGHDDDDDDD